MKFEDSSQNLRARLRFIQVLVVLMLGVLCIRLYVLQVVRGERYAEIAENQRRRRLPIPAPRGVIFDRNGHAIVNSRPIYNVIMSREDVKNKDLNSLSEPLAEGLIVDKDIDPSSLDTIVPSMILQPLVENSIKHGLGRKLGEGRVVIRAARKAGMLMLEVRDNGVGLPPTRMEQESESGIGLRNVNERLRVIYGPPYQLKLSSQPGQGTQARIEVPEMLAPDRVPA